jgi:hypothetical protein
MELSDSELIEYSSQLNDGQSRFQNEYFVSGSQITPYKKVQQSLLELQSRRHGQVELEYKLKKARIHRKKLERDLSNTIDDLDTELLNVELEKTDFDISLYEKKQETYEREISEFCSLIRENMDIDKDINFYLSTDEEEERKYWITRMAKQAAVDLHCYGRIGSGNLDSIINMSPEDQVTVLQGAVHHSSLLTAGVEKMQRQLQPQVEQIFKSLEYTPPVLMETQEKQSLPEVKNNVPTEKIRLHSTNKSKT